MQLRHPSVQCIVDTHICPGNVRDVTSFFTALVPQSVPRVQERFCCAVSSVFSHAAEKQFPNISLNDFVILKIPGQSVSYNLDLCGCFLMFESESVSCSVVSNSLPSHGLLFLWDYLGKNTGVVATSFSWGSVRPRNWTRISCIADRFFTIWTT